MSETAFGLDDLSVRAASHEEAPLPEEQQMGDARRVEQDALGQHNGVQLAPGRVVDASGDPPSGRSRPRTYDAVLVTAGHIMQDDGQPSDWWIPARVLGEAVMEGLFEGIPHYVDHPELFGFGWHQRPSVRDLAGIVSEVAWDGQQVLGKIQLYDTEAGRLLGSLYDQIIGDAGAGRPVPPMGLSIVCYREWERVVSGATDSERRVWTHIHKVSSVDAVYEPGAAGYIRQALSSAALPSAALSSGIRPELTGVGRDHDAGAQPANAQTSPPRTAGPSRGAGTRSNVQTRKRSNEKGGTMPEETPAPVEEPVEEQVIENAAAESPPSSALLSRSAPLSRSPLGPSSAASGATSEAPSAAPEAGALDAISRQLGGLERQVSALTTALAAREEARTVEDMGEAPRASMLYGGWSGIDRVEMALEAMLAGLPAPEGVRPLTGIRELYMLLSGDYELTGRFQEDRVYLANVNTSTMAGLVANRLNKVVINMFQSYDQWWLPGVTIQDFTTLQDVRWITLGGVGELPTVAEGAAYTEMTWDDQTETDSFVKKGGYLGITLETIDKDDTARVMAAPRALAQAAWLTLGKAIAEVFTANSGYGPSMSDSNYLFDNSNHSNQGSTALSFAAWEAVKILMMKFTEVNSAERLGALTRPRLLWVPIDLENTAIEILAAGEGHINDADYHVSADAMATDLMARLRRARDRVVTVPFWTDTNDWVAQADPNMYPGLGLAFRYGRTPEVFSVADPRAGLMFTNDTMPIKVRFFFAVGPTDWRAWYKHIVS